MNVEMAVGWVGVVGFARGQASWGFSAMPTKREKKKTSWLASYIAAAFLGARPARRKTLTNRMRYRDTPTTTHSANPPSPQKPDKHTHTPALLCSSPSTPPSNPSPSSHPGAGEQRTTSHWPAASAHRPTHWSATPGPCAHWPATSAHGAAAEPAAERSSAAHAHGSRSPHHPAPHTHAVLAHGEGELAPFVLGGGDVDLQLSASEEPVVDSPVVVAAIVVVDGDGGGGGGGHALCPTNVAHVADELE